MAATILPDGHKRAIGTPTRLRTILKLGKSVTPGTTYSRVHSRPTAGSRTSSTTTMDLATQTYNKVPPIIRTGAVKTAQDRVCAHSVDRRVGRDERPGDGSRPPEHALGLDIHPVPSGGPGASRWHCHCSLLPAAAAPSSWIRHRCTPARAREEKGQWDVGTCARYEGATTASPALRARSLRLLEITCGCLGAPMDRAHVPVFRLLSLLIRSLR